MRNLRPWGIGLFMYDSMGWRLVMNKKTQTPLERFEKFGQEIFSVKKEDFLRAEAEEKAKKGKVSQRKVKPLPRAI